MQLSFNFATLFYNFQGVIFAWAEYTREFVQNLKVQEYQNLEPEPELEVNDEE